MVCKTHSEGTEKARLLSVLSATLLLVMASPGHAGSINSEANSPQRPTTPVARPAPATAAPTTRPATAQRAAEAPRVTPIIARPVAAPAPRPVQAARTVNVAVLGREGPAAARPAPTPTRAQTPAPQPRQVAITASEPELTPGVRSADVAGYQKIGAPYQVAGTWYVPAHEPDYEETGVASWYGNEFHGKPTANGEIFDMNIVSAAHPTLPIPSLVEVTNLENGRSIVARVNDRGPFVGGRLIDVSSRGAELLGFRQQGHANVRVRYVGPADTDRVVTAQSLTQPRRVADATGTKPLPASATPPPLPTQMAQLTPAPAQNGEAFVQVGAFSVQANAQRLADQAASLGPVRVVETSSASGTPLFRVVLGPVANRAEAALKVQEMTDSGIAGARVMASLN